MFILLIIFRIPIEKQIVKDWNGSHRISKWVSERAASFCNRLVVDLDKKMNLC